MVIVTTLVLISLADSLHDTFDTEISRPLILIAAVITWVSCISLFEDNSPNKEPSGVGVSFHFSQKDLTRNETPVKMSSEELSKKTPEELREMKDEALETVANICEEIFRREQSLR